MMIKAWHFVSDTLRDGKPIPADGKWLTFAGPCVMCQTGLHASRGPFDALQYAPGATLCLVEVKDIEAEDKDKLVCRRRKIISRMDATALMRYFARQQALSVIHLWEKCPPDVVLDFLATGDESLGAAASAATSTASSTAARAAASTAARAAAKAASRAAAWAATGDESSKVAAWAATMAAARNEFNQLVYECFEEFL